MAWFLNLSAGICAGSLVSRCSFDVTCFAIHGDLGRGSSDVVSFGAQNIPFGMPVASTLAPWGTIERSRGTSKHKKGDLEVQAWISVDFG